MFALLITFVTHTLASARTHFGFILPYTFGVKKR